MKWRVRFLVDGKVEGYLRMRVTLDGQRVNFGVQYRVAKKNWSREAQRVVPNSVNGPGRIKGTIINAELQRLEMAASTILEGHALAGEEIGCGEFREEFLRVIGRKDLHGPEPILASHLYQRFILECCKERAWTKNTLHNHKTVMHHLSGWKPRLKIEEFKGDAMQRFVWHLVSLELDNETTLKYLMQVRVFLAWCVEKGHTGHLEALSWRPTLKRSRKPIVFLSARELAIVESYDLSGNPHMERVRDVFVFCCYSGLRYSDVRALNKNDVGDGAINIYTRKTGALLGIDLNEKTRELLKKYDGRDDDHALPVISNQKMNDAVHDLCKLCGINAPVVYEHYVGNERKSETYKKWELATTHCARRTFISLAITAGIPPHVVMKWSGHKDYKSMVPYIGIDGSEKRRYMGVFERSLAKKSDEKSE